MKAIILSAGQGRRLLPRTERAPKCMVSVHGRALIDWQIDHLAACGVDRVTVVSGFGAEYVQRALATRTGVETVFNPFFQVADNLVSCWFVREEMTEDFLLLNGDTLFEPAVVQRILEAPARPVTLAIDHKSHYDDDDMKVRLNGQRLLRVGKDLPPSEVDGESIGMMLFRNQGPTLFRQALERSMQDSVALKKWYLSVIGQMGQAGQVWTQSIEGLDWAEVDYPLDLVRASKMAAEWSVPGEGCGAPDSVNPIGFR